VLALLLVAIVSVTNQAGPLLIEYAINHGMLPRHHSVATILVAGALFLLAVAITATAQRSQTRVTGRLAARVMNDLRVRVFTHLQRLGLDRIVVIDRGRILEVGSHEELLARGGRHGEIYATWTSHMKLAA
jgi:ABC-type multidrug transport system fused ATPase/permease subunit